MPHRLVAIAAQLKGALASFEAPAPVTHTYQPLEYAWPTASEYLRRYGTGKKRALWVGMNPGPFGMAQTGVPFGDVTMVREVLGICGEVGQPYHVHPARPIDGFACPRKEVSGSRVWGFVAEEFASAEAFFTHYFVYNYCPLAFMEVSGRNFTPNKLPAAHRATLFAACDVALSSTIEALGVSDVVGIGGFAYERCVAAARTSGAAVAISQMLHPSPASPLANRGWAAAARLHLLQHGLPTGAAPARPGRPEIAPRPRTAANRGH